MNPLVHMSLRPEIESIPYARLVARRVLCDGDDDPLYFSAFTEIVANAVHAHCQAGIDRPISVDVVLEPDPMVVVCDTAFGFDVTDPMKNRFPGGRGLGLTIANAVCPGLTIDSSGHGTKVSLPYPSIDTR